MAEPVLSVILVNYNVREFLRQALRSIKRALRELPSEVIVVDNASDDGSVELVREEFPEVRLIANSENLGFARANNQAIRLARGRYLALINPDTLVREDTFRTLVDFLEAHPEAGLVGCKVLNADGSLQLACRRSIPTPWVAFTKLSGLSSLFPRTRLFGRYNLTYLDPDQTTEVEAVSGSFMVFRREIIESVGLLDEDYFLYGEDLDWCYRIRKAGWKIYYVPATSIVHFKGQSSRKSGYDDLLLFYRAMLIFVRKHFRYRYLFLPQWFLMAGIGIRGALSFLQRFLSQVAFPLVDLFFLNLSLLIAILIRWGALYPLKPFLVVDVIYSLIWLLSLYFMGCYEHRKMSSARAASGVLIGWVINITVTFFVRQYAFSRIAVLIMGLLNLVFVPGWRVFIRLGARVTGIPFLGTLGRTLLRRRTVVVGQGRELREVVHKLRQRVDGEYEVVGVVVPGTPFPRKNPYGVPILGSVDNLRAIIKSERIEEVIFLTGGMAYEKIVEIIEGAEGSGVTFKMVPDQTGVIIGRASIDQIDGLPLVDIDYRLSYRSFQLMKRLSDWGLSSLLGIFALPVYLYLRFLGGWGLREVPIVNEKGKVVRLPYLVSKGADKKRWVHKLPLIWSIWRGHLSFVGAEIIPVKETQAYKPHIKPGLTGLAQLHAHEGLSPEEKERYELYYLKNYSPLLDLEILLKALFKL